MGGSAKYRNAMRVSKEENNKKIQELRKQINTSSNEVVQAAMKFGQSMSLTGKDESDYVGKFKDLMNAYQNDRNKYKQLAQNYSTTSAYVSKSKASRQLEIDVLQKFSDYRKNWDEYVNFSGKQKGLPKVINGKTPSQALKELREYENRFATSIISLE